MSPWKPIRRLLGKCMFTYKNVQSASFSVMSDSLWPHGLMDCSLPESSAHGIFQESTLEWVAIPFSRGSSWPRDWTLALQFTELVSCIASRVFTLWASREAQECSNHRTLERISQANKVMLKIPQQYMMLQHASTWTKNCPMYQLDLEKVEEPEIKLPNLLDHRKRENSRKKHLFLLHWLH